MRRTLYQLHLWLGLTLGVWLVLVSVTGVVLLFRHPLDRALDAHLLRPSRPLADAADPPRVQPMLDAVASAYAGAVPNRVRFAAADHHHVHEVRFTYADAADDRWFAYVDPSTGRLLGARREDDSLVGSVFLLHSHLLLGDAGLTVNGVGAIAGTLLLGTGLFLWWPARWTQLRQRVTISRGTSRKRQVHDLHNAAGVYSLPVLLVLTVTGAAIAFHEPVEAVVRTLTRSPAPPPTAKAAPRTGDQPLAVDADAAVARAREAHPDLAPGFVFPPTRSDAAWRVTGRSAGAGVATPPVQVLVDPTDGRVLQLGGDAPTRADRAMAWVSPLHYGTWGGLASKLLYVLPGLMPVVLLTTGWMKWRAKVAGRAANRARHAHRTPETVPSLPDASPTVEASP